MIWVCLKIGRHEIPWSRIPVEFLFPLTWTQPKDPYCWLMLLDVGCTFIIIYPSQLMFLIFAVQSRLTRWSPIRPVEFHIAMISPWNAHWIVGYINLRLSLFLHLNFLHMFHAESSVFVHFSWWNPLVTSNSSLVDGLPGLPCGVKTEAAPWRRPKRRRHGGSGRRRTARPGESWSCRICRYLVLLDIQVYIPYTVYILSMY